MNDIELTALGLSPAEETQYRSLVVDGGATTGVLAARLGLIAAEVHEVLDALAKLGLVETVPSDDGAPRWFAAPPDVALHGLLNSRRHELSVAETSVARLAAIFRSDLGQAAIGDLVEVVLGATAVRSRFLQIQRAARHEVCAFVDARPVALSGQENEAEGEALGRGVRFRVVIERSAFEAPGTVSDAVDAIESDAQVRTVDRVPTKLVVADGTVALVPLAVRGYQTAALVIRAAGLVQSLVALFESIWSSAVPIGLGDSGRPVEEAAAGPDDADLAVLALMLTGLTDDAVGKQLGMSGRTVQRRLRVLMDLTGSTSRMQLGWEASERGWVTRRS
ncbi:sugar-specific transcriptional regulator TrmB [Kribbella aluminosa]|uniref:Sugar-specific transcriptional regulator TrmB n=1 Tax=Kribbella aluminosa TaxID=416017 RepID=A0ABS4UKL7_9ACTN|nr:helix-turn-helix domain-containing protein [Kribbella aluminosa]MBP2352174.1 sugar-specific transcriptional regulator TrmB [Kribbella aluminosa]